jgi:predicted GIY-YIG superfamily endonuclease
MVYLLHFDTPIAPGKHTTQHYIGYAADLDSRIKEHRDGHGARLTQVAKERHIGFEVVRTWDGDRKVERQLKNRKNAPRLCPICAARKAKENNHAMV